MNQRIIYHARPNDISSQRLETLIHDFNHQFDLTSNGIREGKVRSQSLRLTLPVLEGKLGNIVSSAAQDLNDKKWLENNAQLIQKHIEQIQLFRATANMPESKELEKLRSELNRPIDWKKIAFRGAMVVGAAMGSAAFVNGFWTKGAEKTAEKLVEKSTGKLIIGTMNEAAKVVLSHT